MAVGGRLSKIGLDFGSHALRAVQLQQSSRRKSVHAMATLTTNTAFSERPSTVSVKERAQAIRRLLSMDRFQGRQVIVAASHVDCVVRIVHLPKMTSAEMDQAVHFEMKKHAYFSGEDYVTDYKVLRPVETPHGPQVETVAVAARKAPINSMLDAIEAARLRSSVVDMEGLAAARALNRDESDAFCITDIGHTHTNISVFDGPDLLVHRSIGVGGYHILNRITSVVGGINSFEELAGMARTQTDATAEAVSDAAAEITLEISRSLDYFRNSRRPVDTLYVTGGGSMLPRVVELISDQVEAEVKVGDPLASIDVDSSRFSAEIITAMTPRIAVAVGLAERGLERE